MPFIFVDSFDHYTAIPGTTGAKWDAVENSGYYSIDASGGRFSTGGLKCTTQSSGCFIQKNIPTVGPTIYVGFGHKTAGLPTSNQTAIINFMDSSSYQCSLGYDASGHLITYNSTAYGGAVLATSSLALAVNGWHFIEVKVTFSNTGIFQVWVDGVEWIPDDAVDTLSTANAQATSIRLFGSSGAVTTYNRWIDDLYIHDTARQGDIHIVYKAPNGPSADGAGHTQWTPSAGANWQCVDDAAPDPSGDYVSTSTLNNIDTYTVADIALSSGNVLAVVGNYFCQKTDAGARQIDMATRLSSTDLLTGSPQAIGSSWGYLQFIQETKPGGGAWTVQDTKDAEMGMKLTT